MAESYETPAPEPTVDTTALTKTEVPTSQGMMWQIASPTGGVLAMVRHEDAADLVLAALASYTPPAPPQEDPPAGYMSPEDMAKAYADQQASLHPAPAEPVAAPNPPPGE